jgi:hypothetical protein
MLHSLDLSHCSALQLDVAQYAATSSKSSNSSERQKPVAANVQRTSTGGSHTVATAAAVHSSRSKPPTAVPGNTLDDSSCELNDNEEAVSSGVPHQALPASTQPPELLVTGPSAQQEGLRHRRLPSAASAEPASNSNSASGIHTAPAAFIPNTHSHIQCARQVCCGCEGKHCSSTQHPSVTPDSYSNGEDGRQQSDEDILSLSDAGLHPLVRAHQMHMRLLRSALGRLTTLRDLRLRGNNLRGLFSGLAAHQQHHHNKPAPNVVPNLSTGVAASQEPPEPAGSAVMSSGTPVSHGLPNLDPVSTASSRPPPQGHPGHASTLGALESFAATLGRLTSLDVSHCQGVTGVEVGAMLAAATSLTHLDASGLKHLQCQGVELPTQCRGAAAAAAAGPKAPAKAPEAQSLTHEAHSRVSQNGCQPQGVHSHNQPCGHSHQGPQALRSLSLSWGFSRTTVQSLCAASGATLLILELGVGNCLTDALLARVARACPSLQVGGWYPAALWWLTLSRAAPDRAVACSLALHMHIDGHQASTRASSF